MTIAKFCVNVSYIFTSSFFSDDRKKPKKSSLGTQTLELEDMELPEETREELRVIGQTGKSSVNSFPLLVIYHAFFPPDILIITM